MFDLGIDSDDRDDEQILGAKYERHAAMHTVWMFLIAWFKVRFVFIDFTTYCSLISSMINLQFRKRKNKFVYFVFCRGTGCAWI